MPIKIYGTDKLVKSISFKVGHSGSNLADLVYGFKTWPNQFGSIVGDSIWNTGTQIVEFSSVGVILVKKQPVDTATIKIQIQGQYNSYWLENESSIKVKFSIMPDKEFTIPIKRYGNGGWYEEWYGTDHAERSDVEKLAQMFIDMDGSDQVVDAYIYPNILTDVKRVVDVIGPEQYNTYTLSIGSNSSGTRYGFEYTQYGSTNPTSWPKEDGKYDLFYSFYSYGNITSLRSSNKTKYLGFDSVDVKLIDGSGDSITLLDIPSLVDFSKYTYKIDAGNSDVFDWLESHSGEDVTLLVGKFKREHELLEVRNTLKISGNTRTYTVFERAKPVVTLEPVDTTINSGDSVTFTSDAEDYVSSQWYVQGIQTLPINGETGKDLTITPSAGDSGKKYYNVYKNIAGVTLTHAAILTIAPDPTKIFDPALVDVTGGFGGDWGSTISFSNSVKGNKDIDVTKLNDDPEYAYISMKPELFSHVQGIKIDNGLVAKWPHRMATINGKHYLLFRSPYKLTLRKVNFEVVWSK